MKYLKNTIYGTVKNYIRTKEWKNRKLKYYQNYPKICFCCNSKQNIQLHHRTYERIGGIELDSDLVALCNRCHRKAHIIHKRKKCSLYIAHLFIRPRKTKIPKKLHYIDNYVVDSYIAPKNLSLELSYRINKKKIFGLDK